MHSVLAWMLNTFTCSHMVTTHPLPLSHPHSPPPQSHSAEHWYPTTSGSPGDGGRGTWCWRWEWGSRWPSVGHQRHDNPLLAGKWRRKGEVLKYRWLSYAMTCLDLQCLSWRTHEPLPLAGIVCTGSGWPLCYISTIASSGLCAGAEKRPAGRGTRCTYVHVRSPASWQGV